MFKILFTLFIFSTFALGGPYSVYLSDAWTGFFDFVNAYMWILSLLPIVVVIYSTKLASKELNEMSSGNKGKEAEKGATGVYAIWKYVSTALYTTLSLFFIYGAFVLVFAGGTSMSTGWTNLVVKPIKHIFL